MTHLCRLVFLFNDAAATENHPLSLPDGLPISVTDTTANQGQGSASASTTRYYLSADTAKDAGDTLLSPTRSVGVLAPTGSEEHTAELQSLASSLCRP